MQNFLYHYCPLEAFLGIVQAKQIWLTNIFCMNDAAEHYWLRRIAQQVLSKMPNVSEELSKSLASKLFPKEEDTDLYCCCLSGAPDSLSQWRAYADDGRGVAIGISRQFLRQTIKKYHGLRLASVVYDQVQQKSIVESILNSAEEVERILNSAEEAVDEDQSSASSLPEGVTDGLPAVFAKVGLWWEAARCKNPHFHEEYEERLIYVPSVEKDSPSLGQQRFRSRADILIPYHALPLRMDVNNPKIPVLYEIVFGPKNAYRRNERVARLLLEESGCNPDRIRF